MQRHQKQNHPPSADEEGSALSWADNAKANGKPLTFEVIAGDRSNLAKQARALEQRGTVIMDTPPNNREVLQMAGMLAWRYYRLEDPKVNLNMAMDVL